MRKKLCLGLAVVLLTASGLLANGLNLNGFGARATAMGGAFVGLADDFTAVFWNPAGLAQLTKSTFGLAGHLLLPTSDYTLSSFTMETHAKMYPSGLVGYFQPIGNRVVVGVGAYTLSGLGQDWNNTGLENALIYPYPAAAFTPAVEAYTWKSFIGSITISPAIAVKLTDRLFLGATFNANYGFFKTDQWAQYAVVPLEPPVLYNFGQAHMDITGWGYGATFGVLYKPTDRVSFGVTYRLQSKMKLSGTSKIQNLSGFGVYLEGQPTIPDKSPATLNVTSPMWLAGGLAVKPLNDWTVTFDLQWTNWKKLDLLTVNFQDPVWMAIGKTTQTEDLYWANKLQIRVGTEYKIGDFALRAGYYNDPAPAPASTMNILIPGFTYNSVAFGVGYGKKGGLHVDLGLEYLIGQKRTVAAAYDNSDHLINMPGIYTMHIPVPFISAGYGW